MKLFITATIIFSAFFLHAQTLSFEDQNFLDALIAEGIDSNNDNLIQVSEAEAVNEIDINGKDFRSLKGIEGFVNLEYLTIYSNDLIDTIDLMVLPNLTNLIIGDCIELISVSVSGHPSLEDIYCTGASFGTTDQLEELNISNISYLKKVRIQFMETLSSIILANNENLVDMMIENNNILFDIDVSDLKSLESLVLTGP